MRGVPREAPPLDFIARMARQSGSIIKRYYDKPKQQAVEFKTDGTKVTAADHAVHEYVVNRMAEHFPRLPIIGEEGVVGQRTGDPNEFWLLMDELDGTHAFTHGIPVSVVMIALMEGDHPIRSAIADPFSNRLYKAGLGMGAYLNGSRIQVKKKTPAYPIANVSSWPHNGKSDMLVPEMVSGVAGDLHHLLHCAIEAIGGIGLAETRVASGEFSATVFPGTHSWDTAAGDLLVREAGGITTDLHGKPLRYSDSFDGGGTEGHIFAATKDLHTSIVKVVKKYYP